jgi:hypothetical protein
VKLQRGERLPYNGLTIEVMTCPVGQRAHAVDPSFALAVRKMPSVAASDRVVSAARQASRRGRAAAGQAAKLLCLLIQSALTAVLVHKKATEGLLRGGSSWGGLIMTETGAGAGWWLARNWLLATATRLL